jgi:hypothetical protein
MKLVIALLLLVGCSNVVETTRESELGGGPLCPGLDPNMIDVDDPDDPAPLCPQGQCVVGTNVPGARAWACMRPCDFDPTLPCDGPAYCNQKYGGPSMLPDGSVQDCRKSPTVKFTMREKQAIGPKDNAQTKYDADSCIGDWLDYLHGPNGAGNWNIIECTTAATVACAGGDLTTWADDRLVPFTAQDRHRAQMDVTLSCAGVAEGGTPLLLGNHYPNTGGAGGSGQELCGLVNGQSYGSQYWATTNAFRMNLRGEPPGLIGAGFNMACSFCGSSPNGGFFDRCSNSSIMMDYAGNFTCRNGSPSVKVTYGAVTVFPSSRFDILAAPIDAMGNEAPASTVFQQQHLMERPYGAAGLVLWNPPPGPRPDGATTTLIAGPIPANRPCAVAPVPGIAVPNP